ncbi:hypothetical protein JG687_00008100 [Phytophthora cactorum]|uniref:Uncharacterized protein n=1 Tax=Phytophthora cactorum TaxID=29920 RepID=A0A8T1UGI7_9STRA|nr:hypothetical protein JG687_00008100 [Phytophthora cactorum]
MWYLWFELVNHSVVHAEDGARSWCLTLRKDMKAFGISATGCLQRWQRAQRLQKCGLLSRMIEKIYLKPTKHGGQSKYGRLINDNFRAALQHQCRLATPRDKQSSFHLGAFLYVLSTTQPPSQFQRVTAGRIERARLQRMVYEAANAVSVGPITAHHLDTVHTRQPDSASFAVPDDNTTAQAMELDKNEN